MDQLENKKYLNFKQIKMNQKPLHDRILIKRIDLEIKTAGGIILGEMEKDRDTGYGRVVAVGDGKKIETGTIPMTVKEGDIVSFNERIPIRLNYRGEDFYILRESDVFTIVDDNELVEKPYVTEGSEYENMTRKFN